MPTGELVARIIEQLAQLSVGMKRRPFSQLVGQMAAAAYVKAHHNATVHVLEIHEEPDPDSERN